MKDNVERTTFGTTTLSGSNSAAQLLITNASWRACKHGKTILFPISLELNSGRVLGVVGPNGAGKSTLLRLLYRYQRPTTGSIKIDGRDIWSLPARQIARQVAVVLQEQPTDFGLTVRDLLALGRIPHRKGLTGIFGAEDQTIVDNILDRLNLMHLSDRHLKHLSGGERQRVMVARALAQQPRLLILDEPTNHLDIRHQLEVLALIRDLPLTIVTSLHDLNMASEVCDDILLLHGGHPLGFGPPETVLTESSISEAFGVKTRRQHLAPSNTKHMTFHL